MEDDNIVQYTPGYEAPEQRRRDPTIIDERTDIYQIGILLYEIIEGKKPETLTFTRTPQYMKPIITKCLMENPDERYQTIDELIAELRIEKTQPTPTPIPTITEKPEWMQLPPIERVKKFLEEIENKPVAISIEKIAEELGLTPQQVKAAINIAAKEKGVAILEERVITIPGVIQLALKTQKPLSEILAGQKLPTEWWQKLLEEIERQNVVVPFGEPTITRAAERSEKIRAKVAICAEYAVPKKIEEQIQKYVEGRKTTQQLIQDTALAFGLTLQTIQAIVAKQWRIIFKHKHRHTVESVSWSPDGRFLATGSSDYYVKVFRVGDWTKIFEHNHRRGVIFVTWSPGGRYIATVDSNHYVRVFRVGDWAKIFEFKHWDYLYSVSWSPDGRFLATGKSNGNYVRVFRVGDWSKIFEHKHEGSVYSVSWSPDGRFLATGSGDCYVRVFLRCYREYI